MPYPLLLEPERLPQAFVDAWNLRDAQRLATLFDEDADFVNVTGLWWHSREAIARAHAYGLSTIFNNSTLSLLKIKVRNLSDTIAVVHARVKLTGQTPVQGIEQPGERRTLFTFVVHKQGTGWSCVSAHNTDISYRETHVRDDRGQLLAVDYRNQTASPKKSDQPATPASRLPLRHAR